MHPLGLCSSSVLREVREPSLLASLRCVISGSRMAAERPGPALQGALPAVPMSTQSSPQKEVSPEHCQRWPADQPCQAFPVLHCSISMQQL